MINCVLPGEVRCDSVTTMKSHSDLLAVSTCGKGTYEITDDVSRIIRSSGVTTGIANVFLQHTSASLVIYENADPSARADLHEFFERLVPEDEDYYSHTAEGPDDTTSHLRMVLTRSSESIPVVQGRLALGTWQGIFVVWWRIRRRWWSNFRTSSMSATWWKCFMAVESARRKKPGPADDRVFRGAMTGRGGPLQRACNCGEV